MQVFFDLGFKAKYIFPKCEEAWRALVNQAPGICATNKIMIE